MSVRFFRKYPNHWWDSNEKSSQFPTKPFVEANIQPERSLIIHRRTERGKRPSIYWLTAFELLPTNGNLNKNESLNIQNSSRFSISRIIVKRLPTQIFNKNTIFSIVRSKLMRTRTWTFPPTQKIIFQFLLLQLVDHWFEHSHFP